MKDSKELGQFIPLHYHFNMLQDRVRMEGFKKAIELMVQPGDVVLELGGGTGVMSFFAAQRAKKVYCVEYNPALADEARKLLVINPGGERVEVINEDACVFIPPEPVQVVVCEMMHVGHLREKQLEVIDAFKANYTKHFGGQIPMFIPGATIHAVQLVNHDFMFCGYHAPVVLFQDPYAQHDGTIQLSNPEVYYQVMYDVPYGLDIKWKGQLRALSEGKANALRFITKNILAIVPGETQSVDWHNQYLVQPLEKEINLTPGQVINVEFEYTSGAPLTDLTPVVSF